LFDIIRILRAASQPVSAAANRSKLQRDFVQAGLRPEPSFEAIVVG
jgi:hypothetical protein